MPHAGITVTPISRRHFKGREYFFGMVVRFWTYKSREA
jgi:hypothetical protein